MSQFKSSSWRENVEYGQIKRSDGSSFILWAWCMGGIAVFVWIIAFMTPTTSYSGQFDPTAAAGRGLLILSGAGFASLWLTLLIAGSIIRAIYFLPGDAIKESAETLIVRERARRRSEIFSSDDD